MFKTILIMFLLVLQQQSLKSLIHIYKYFQAYVNFVKQLTVDFYYVAEFN